MNVNNVFTQQSVKKIKIYCDVKDKTYYWGQCIPCDYKEIKKNTQKREETEAE